MSDALAASRLLPADILRVGASGLRSRRLRAALSALGVAIGIASMVAVLGVSESSKADLLAALDRLGTNLLEVSPGQTFTGDDAELPEAAPGMVRRIGPSSRRRRPRCCPRRSAERDKIDEAETGGITVVAADPDLPERSERPCAAARSSTTATARYPTVVLGSGRGAAARHRPSGRERLAGGPLVHRRRDPPVGHARRRTSTAPRFVGFDVADRLSERRPLADDDLRARRRGPRRADDATCSARPPTRSTPRRST